MDEDILRKNNLFNIKSEGRDFKRFGEEGDVVLKFFSNAVRGRLINISAGGILCSFNSNNPLPELAQTVGISLDIDNKGNVFEAEGTVIRIQPPPVDPQDIDIAVKFINLTPQKKHEIKKVLNLLMTKSKGYKYFEPLVEPD